MRLDGPDIFAEGNLQGLYDHGQDDASFGYQGGLIYAEYDREADSFLDAVLTAFDEVESALPGLRVSGLD